MIHASVYTFGFGSDHDPYLLKTISDATGGMYCYVKNADQVCRLLMFRGGFKLKI